METPRRLDPLHNSAHRPRLRGTTQPLELTEGAVATTRRQVRSPVSRHARARPRWRAARRSSAVGPGRDRALLDRAQARVPPGSRPRQPLRGRVRVPSLIAASVSRTVTILGARHGPREHRPSAPVPSASRRLRPLHRYRNVACRGMPRGGAAPGRPGARLGLHASSADRGAARRLLRRGWLGGSASRRWRAQRGRGAAGKLDEVLGKHRRRGAEFGLLRLQSRAWTARALPWTSLRPRRLPRRAPGARMGNWASRPDRSRARSRPSATAWSPRRPRRRPSTTSCSTTSSSTCVTRSTSLHSSPAAEARRHLRVGPGLRPPRRPRALQVRGRRAPHLLLDGACSRLSFRPRRLARAVSPGLGRTLRGGLAAQMSRREDRRAGRAARDPARRRSGRRSGKCNTWLRPASEREEAPGSAQRLQTAQAAGSGRRLGRLVSALRSRRGLWSPRSGGRGRVARRVDVERTLRRHDVAPLVGGSRIARPQHVRA